MQFLMKKRLRTVFDSLILSEFKCSWYSVLYLHEAALRKQLSKEKLENDGRNIASSFEEELFWTLRKNFNVILWHFGLPAFLCNERFSWLFSVQMPLTSETFRIGSWRKKPGVVFLRNRVKKINENLLLLEIFSLFDPSGIQCKEWNRLIFCTKLYNMVAKLFNQIGAFF